MKQLLLSTLFLLVVCLSATFGATAHAATNAILTVNSTKDTDDHSCDARGTGIGNKDCTLREAIEIANGTVGVQETIEFSIPETINTPGTCGLLNHTCAIVLLSPLPAIVDPLSIDGYSQPGASPNTLALGDDAKIKIILYGANLPQSSYGLTLTAGKSTVRGLNIAKFGAGIMLQSDKNTIAGNFIGTDNTGQSAQGNLLGIGVYGTANQIGGTVPADRNVVSGNQAGGVILSSGARNTVQGNYVGTNAQGLVAVPNGHGIWLANSNQNTIGGKGKSARNIISGNQGAGIYAGGIPLGNRVQGNFIGVGSNGTTTLGNAQMGIRMATDAVPAPVPSQLTVLRNRIANNGQQGIGLSVTDQDVISNVTISHNAIFNNGALGIDLWSDGITPNDKGDGDSGPNNVQNFPVLKSALSSATAITVNGKFNSVAERVYRLEFFVSPTCNNFGYGEGKKFLGAVNVTTDSQGNASIHFVKAKHVTPGTMLTATATELVQGNSGSTSEFSKCVTVVAQ